MPHRPQFKLAGTDTDAPEVTITLDAGEVEATREYDLWNDKGGVHADTETLISPRLRAEVWDGARWVSSGEPPVDERWLEVSVTDIESNDSSMTEQTTGWVALGTGSELILGSIPKNCSREISARITPFPTASESAWEFRLTAVPGEYSQGLANKVGLNHGVINDKLIEGVRRVKSGFGVSASGETVTAAAGSLTYDGVVVTQGSGQNATLNQNDSAAAALAATESYKAVISLTSAGVITATKGTKAVSPTTPATPSGNVYLATVTVNYQAGGTSDILAGDISTTGFARGEYLVEEGTGLNVTIGAGQAVCYTDRLTYHSTASSLEIEDDDTSYVYVLPDGTFEYALSETAPATGAELLAEVLAAAGAISSVTDRRSLLE